MKVLLVGNYELDRQESMQRFAWMLQQELQNLGHEVQLLQPPPRLGLIKGLGHGLAKWLGYIDKFILFPRQLTQAKTWADVVHICDHSNAMYVQHLQDTPHVVTCHDLLAVRAALGEETACSTSATGQILQRWILQGLRRAQRIVCDSSHTQQDAHRLAQPSQPTRVILLGQNHTYQKLEAETYQSALQSVLADQINQPYILHVGSSLPRKNREGILRIFHQISDQWPGNLVFAGQPLPPELRVLAHQLGLSNRVIEVCKPDNTQLEALYNGAFALLFPSKAEGFGWPIIEAQACGCPVLCSDRTSLPEVAGTGAWIRAVEDEAGFAQDLLKLRDPELRQELIQKGFQNLSRFSRRAMCEQYVEVYQELIQSSCASSS